MTATHSPGPTIHKKPNFEEFEALKKRLSEDPNSDVREAYHIIVGLEAYIAFLLAEFHTVNADYNLEVMRCNQIKDKLNFATSLLKKR